MILWKPGAEVYGYAGIWVPITGTTMRQRHWGQTTLRTDAIEWFKWRRKEKRFVLFLKIIIFNEIYYEITV